MKFQDDISNMNTYIHTDKPKPICPPLFQSWGHKNVYPTAVSSKQGETFRSAKITEELFFLAYNYSKYAFDSVFIFRGLFKDQITIMRSHRVLKKHYLIHIFVNI